MKEDVGGRPKAILGKSCRRRAGGQSSQLNMRNQQPSHYSPQPGIPEAYLQNIIRSAI